MSSCGHIRSRQPSARKCGNFLCSPQGGGRLLQPRLVCFHLISNPLQPGPLGPDLGELGGGVLESRTERNTLGETGLAQENRSLRYYHAGLLHKNRWGWDQMIGWWWWSSPRRLPNIILGAVPCGVPSADAAAC